MLFLIIKLGIKETRTKRRSCDKRYRASWANPAKLYLELYFSPPTSFSRKPKADVEDLSVGVNDRL